MKYIYFTERNSYGAIVVYGEIGVKQYYGYSESQARKMYTKECESKIIIAK